MIKDLSWFQQYKWDVIEQRTITNRHFNTLFSCFHLIPSDSSRIYQPCSKRKETKNELIAGKMCHAMLNGLDMTHLAH